MPQAKPLFGTPLNRAHPLAQGLVGCWLLNEQSGPRGLDQSPFANPVGFVGTGWGTGPYGSALICTRGLGSPVLTTLANTYLPLGNAARSVTCTIKRTAVETTANYCFGYGTSSPTNLFSIDAAVPANSHVRVVGYADDWDTGYVLPANEWHTLTVTYNGINRLTLYVDGAYQATTTSYTFNTLIGAVRMCLNGWPGGTYPFTGLQSHAMIWSRCLSAAEVAHQAAFPFAMFDTNSNYQLDPSQVNTPILTGFPI